MATINTTHRNVTIILTALNEISSKYNSKNIRFSYAVAKNIRACEQHVNIFREMAKPLPAFNEYEIKRVTLNEKYAVVDDVTGKPKITHNKYTIIPEKLETFNEEMKKLRDEYSYVFDDAEQKKAKIESMMDDACEIDLHMFRLSWMPDAIAPKYIDSLMIIIEDDMSETNTENKK